MSDWGDDELEGIEAQPVDVDEPDAPTFGVDVRSLAGQLVDVAVQSAVGGEVSKAAQAAVKELMTPEVREAIRRRADEAAAAAIAEQVEGPQDAEPAPELYYGSVDEFVREYLRNVYRRRIDGRHRCWAGRWWEHDEAVIRLEALWRSWEHLRQDAATGMSVWWRDHADHHMAVLMDPDGPFATATEGEENTSKRGEPLPYVEPPEGMFPDVREEPADPPGDDAH
ncbi:DUF4913 domain-containing protein [Kocuria sp. ICS0012]|uniref:DUF4913 domain-containing protein n=1 Tax=Kocuria sp. ICS0012 TaxID=1834155 RepID=UPI0009EF3054|nr:DUF4913 domain-containing protein [Kocuria sp. ICS0012]